MKSKIIVPKIGESVTEVIIGSVWKKSGDHVRVDEELLEVESEKATLTVNAEKEGVLTLQVKTGDRLAIGDVLGEIEETQASKSCDENCNGCTGSVCREQEGKAVEGEDVGKNNSSLSIPIPKVSPAAAKIFREHDLDPNTLITTSAFVGSGPKGTITKEDAIRVIKENVVPASQNISKEREVLRKKMSLLRKTTAKHLLESRHATAMLTSFNEVDMTRFMNLRQSCKESFQKKYGVSLGYVSFFAKVCSEVLKEIPELNSRISGDDILYPNYVDMGIAVATERGLVVPVVRDCDQLSIASIEQQIAMLAEKARKGKILPDEMKDGTFTITNGGVFGSMLSTPLLNYPQVGILGMHAITERAVVVDGHIVIRPMMYLALSYDHQIIDGKQAVQFLVKVKEYVENPERLLILF